MDVNGKTILVVDDDPLLRSVIAFDLKRNGFTVLEAESGNRAIKVVKDNSVDLILSDVRMPDGDGIGLLDAVKNLNVRTPVIMLLTGFADISPEEAYSKGADALFAKPFDRKELIDAITRAMMPPTERYSLSDSIAVTDDFKIRLDLSSLEDSFKDKVLELGRGGMFVSLKEPLPLVNQTVAFSITFKSGDIQILEGLGVVRWVRTCASGETSQGCGLEFKSLSDQCLNQITGLLDVLNIRAFIPKGFF